MVSFRDFLDPRTLPSSSFTDSSAQAGSEEAQRVALHEPSQSVRPTPAPLQVHAARVLHAHSPSALLLKSLGRSSTSGFSSLIVWRSGWFGSGYRFWSYISTCCL